MVPIMALWAPILVSAVLVFLASGIIHMALGYHRADFKDLPADDAFLASMRQLKIPPGDYLVPCVRSTKDVKNPEYVKKRTEGPIVVMTVIPGAPPSMGKELTLWFLYCIGVGVFAAYLAGRALPAGADYLAVFRFAGTTAFSAYALAQFQQSIWYHRSWGTTMRNVLDGLLYGLLTGGAFGWLWPH